MNSRLTWTLFLAGIIFHLGAFALTIHVLPQPGFVELNPFMGFLLENGGTVATLLVVLAGYAILARIKIHYDALERHGRSLVASSTMCAVFALDFFNDVAVCVEGGMI